MNNHSLFIISILGTFTPGDNHDQALSESVTSFRKKFGDAADRNLKEKLMKHLQMDIFKEVTFERLITEYSIVKREACGAKDDEIVDIDWCDILAGFGTILKTRMSASSRAILVLIFNKIDSNPRIVSKQAAKDRYELSMHAFLRHGTRTINSVVNKTVHKIGTHFDSMNFSDSLPKHSTFVGKNKGYEFAFSASMYDLFDSNANTDALVESAGGGVFGIDPLLREIMKSGPKEEHMTSIIKYTLIKKTMYQNCPESYGALHKYLTEKAPKAVVAAVSAVVVPSEVAPVVLSVAAADGLNVGNHIVEAVGDHYGNVTQLEMADQENQLLLLSVAALSNATPALNHPNKQLFPPIDGGIDSPSPSPMVGVQNINSPIVIDNADELTGVRTPRTLIDEVTTTLKQFLELFFSDVGGADGHLALKLNTKNNVRNTQNLSILKFLEEHHELDESELYELFCDSSFFKSMSCGMFIPFELEAQYNIRGDGYCFYRAIFMLLLREKGGYKLTAEELCQMDQLLKAVGDASSDSLRAEFQHFFQHIEELFPDSHAKSKAATAGCTFASLGTYLNERFWGGSDSVPFLDYSCTAFSYSREEKSSLKGCWAKMFCTSIPGLVHGRDTLDFATVGNAYSLYDVLVVLMRPHNWLLHKQVHYFVADHPTVGVFLDSFSFCLRRMLNELRSRITASKTGGGGWDFTTIYKRIVDGTSNASDLLSITEALDSLKSHLTNGHFVIEATDTEEEASATPQKTEKKDCFLETPFGATQAQKIYISTINNTVSHIITLLTVLLLFVTRWQ
jgi:hypothetical protein